MEKRCTRRKKNARREREGNGEAIGFLIKSETLTTPLRHRNRGKENGISCYFQLSFSLSLRFCSFLLCVISLPPSSFFFDSLYSLVFLEERTSQEEGELVSLPLVFLSVLPMIDSSFSFNGYARQQQQKRKLNMKNKSTKKMK